MVKGARQREWPLHLSTHTHTHWILPTTMSVLETPFDIHVSSVYQTHTCMQAPIPTLCISAKKTPNKGSRTRPIMSTLMPRSGIPVICSRATLSCDSSYCICENKITDQLRPFFCYTDSTIPLFPKSEFSSLWPSSVAVQPGLCQTWSETPKTDFLTTRLICNSGFCGQTSLIGQKTTCTKTFVVGGECFPHLS